MTEKLSPFMAIFIQQFLTYVSTHVDEIIALLLSLINGEPSEELKTAIAAYKKHPSEATLNTVVNKITEEGSVEAEEVAATLLSHAKVK